MIGGRCRGACCLEGGCLGSWPGSVWLYPPAHPHRSPPCAHFASLVLAGACAPGFALRARAAATPAVLRARDAAGDHAVPPPGSQDFSGPWALAHSPVQQSGGREKNRAVGRSGRRGVPMPMRGTRRIGATNRGAACVALRNPLSGDICRPPRPGECPQRDFFHAPRGHLSPHTTPETGRAATSTPTTPRKLGC